jgi:hypothetical protein
VIETYNILEIDINDYLEYHWKRTEEARKKLGIQMALWTLIWEKNYYQEKCDALERN